MLDTERHTEEQEGLLEPILNRAICNTHGANKSGIHHFRQELHNHGFILIHKLNTL